MIDLNQTEIQKIIERKVTNYLGFNSKTNYDLGAYKDYEKCLPQEEIKNTSEGLQAHLAEMQQDLEWIDLHKKYEPLKKDFRFFRVLLGRMGYLKICMRNNRLKNKAIKAVIKEKGGLSNFIKEEFVEKVFGNLDEGVFALTYFTNKT